MAMTFEDLESWQRARDLVRRIYELTRDQHVCRDFALCSQIQRAAVSIMSNVAEGFERVHLPEKMQFYNIARSSTGEVGSLLYVIEDNYLEQAIHVMELRNSVVLVGKLISGLIRSTEERRSS